MDNKSVFLNIGCGDHRIDGFVNIDLASPSADLNIDVNEGLPFEPHSVAGVRCEHFIEHLSRARSYGFFREVRRVMRPDGVLRIATPDLRQICEAYLQQQRMDWEQQFGYGWISSRSEMLNLALREWGHQWIYDEEDLVRTAESCGFSALKRCMPAESHCERFRGLDYRSQSLTIEFKPAAGERSSSSTGSTSRPSVSILIPAFNPAFFEEALRSALAQDYPHFDIVISDDSPDERIAAIVARHADPRITYQRNAAPFGPSQNYVELFRLARGDYVKFLNDDDVLEPGCVSELANVLDRFPQVSLATSYRRRIDENGNPLPDDHVTRPVVDKNCIVSGQYAYSLLNAGGNYIGEPSTVMFRRQQMQDLAGGLFEPFGASIAWNVDMAMWLKLLSAGDLAYLIAPLSRFRIHGAQVQKDPKNSEPLYWGVMELKKVAARVGMDTAPRTQHVALAIN